MASLALRIKNHRHITSNITFHHHFSSSSNNNDDNTPKRSLSFDDVRSSLKHAQQHRQQNQPSSGFRPSNVSSQIRSKGPSVDEIRQNLSEFRRRSVVPTPDSKQPTSLQDLYKRHVANPNPNEERGPKGPVQFDTLMGNLRQLNKNQAEKGQHLNDRLSLSRYKESFTPGPPMADGRKIYGGSSEELPVTIFGKELTEKESRKEGGSKNDEADTSFVREYTFNLLGEKLRGLRPDIATKEGGEGNWFSLQELNERLKKLRKIDGEETSRTVGTVGNFLALRQSMVSLKREEDEKTAQKFYTLGGLTGALSSTTPPKEHLVERYFHPDNMSSGEKLKLKLEKVRDEFKMHETDCGSTRVQIAQLSTEISHLSSVLHKKDKHSRRGLIAKVQQRKKLLKYLRTTDWDSYCLVLSKLGLRDNPDYKH